MISVSILVPEHAVMQAIADPRYLFTTVNHFLSQANQPPAFDIRLVGAGKEVRLADGMFSVHTDLRLEEVEKTDLIIIPALFGDLQAAVEANRDLVPWVVEHYQRGSEVASLCVGAFLLATTGLLKHKKCSTHWAFSEEFKTMFDDVDLVDGSIITEENRIYSSGGANSYWNLLLYLVEKYTDRNMAIFASKYFAIDIERSSQSMFAIFNGQKGHKDAAIIRAQEYIEKNIEEKITIDELADMVAVSRRSFERRFKLATNNSVLEYIQRVRIEAAKRSFETSRKYINEVMYEVGYTDTKAFRTTFKKVTGLTPVAYRNKYSKAGVS